MGAVAFHHGGTQARNTYLLSLAAEDLEHANANRRNRAAEFVSAWVTTSKLMSSSLAVDEPVRARVIQGLSRQLTDSPPHFAAAAFTALCTLAPEEQQLLFQAANKAPKSDRKAIAKDLATIYAPEIVDFLVRWLDEDAHSFPLSLLIPQHDDRVSARLRTILRTPGDPQILNTLVGLAYPVGSNSGFSDDVIRLFDDTDPQVRNFSEVYLQYARDALPHLLSLYATTTSMSVRQRTSGILGKRRKELTPEQQRQWAEAPPLPATATPSP